MIHFVDVNKNEYCFSIENIRRWRYEQIERQYTGCDSKLYIELIHGAVITISDKNGILRDKFELIMSGFRPIIRVTL